MSTNVTERRRSRRTREREQRRADILEAARRVFAEKGFSQATIEEIADGCELSPGTIYLYFRSKEELYVSLLFQAMELFEENFRKILSSRRRPERKVRAVWDFFFDFYTEYRELYRVFLFLHSDRLCDVLSETVVSAVNSRSARNFFVGAEIIKETMTAGVYREVDPLETVDTLWSLFLGLVHQYETRQNLGIRTFTLRDTHRHAFELFERGLLAQPRGRPLAAPRRG
ncbi:MAG: TetR/AcrR family transcriptional regulator [Candidatus Binatia bacterium]